MKLREAVEVTTVVSAEQGWIRLLQAESGAAQGSKLLAVKARQSAGLSEQAQADLLAQLVQSLSLPPRRVLGVLSRSEVLTRYLLLPSGRAEELRAMAFYQLEGLLPFPVEECVVAVKIIGTVGEATRVLAVAARRSQVERLMQVCRGAGLTLDAIGISSEAIAGWHHACQADSQQPAGQAWLVVEIAETGVDLSVLVEGQLVYMRQLPAPEGGFNGLVAQLRETLQAYEREQIGPAVKQVTLSGCLQGSSPAAAERLDALLGIPVSRVDPGQGHPFQEITSMTSDALLQEVSFTDLLGVVSAPQLLELDLLPSEARLQQQARFLVRQRRQAVVAAISIGLLLLAWGGTKLGVTAWRLQDIQGEVRLLKSQASRAQAMAVLLEQTVLSAQRYALELSALELVAQAVEPGTTLQFLGLESGQGLTLRGRAPDLDSVTRYAARLRKETLWKRVILRSTKAQERLEGPRVGFDLFLEFKDESPIEKTS